MIRSHMFPRASRSGWLRWGTWAAALILGVALQQSLSAQQAVHPVAPVHNGAAPASDLPQLVDITAKTGIHFTHLSSPNKKYIVESMSGGVALIDYDRDGWPDIFFTNAPDVDMSLAGTKARSALYHNNHDGTFTDVTEKAGVGHPCWAMGATVGDYNNDGWPDSAGLMLRRRGAVSEQWGWDVYGCDQGVGLEQRCGLGDGRGLRRL